MIDKPIWKHDRMLLGDLVFKLAHNKDDDSAFDEKCFIFYKVKELIDQYTAFFSNKSNFYPQNVVELGIWDGGSTAYWFEFFRPHKHVAIDILSKQDSPYFKHYLQSRNLEHRIKTYWNTNQGDADRLREIVYAEFNSPLDLIIDDASHLYEPSKTSFETLFPLLRPGGLYAIEDWNWSYLSEYQAPDHEWAKEIPLSKLVFDIIEATGTPSLLIRNLYITRNLIIVERGTQPLEPTEFLLDNFISRRVEITVDEEELKFDIAVEIDQQDPVDLPETADPLSAIYASRLKEILEKAPKIASPKELFGEIEDDFWLWMHTEGYRRIPELRNILPGLPDVEIQLGFTGESGDPNLRSGFEAYRLFKQIAMDNVEKDRHLDKVLDFGCGWGRVIRFFQKDIEPSNLWGADCMTFAQEVFKETKTDKWCNFELNDPMPPISFDDDTFDLIYCNSVFSHLTEDTHQRWLVEFHRILRPGGLLIATTWGKDFIAMCAELRKKPESELSAWEAKCAKCFPDTAEALSAYDDGRYLFASQREVQYLDSSFYGEACIPQGYVLDWWTKYFEFVDFIDDRDVFPQNVIVVRE